MLLSAEPMSNSNRKRREQFGIDHEPRIVLDSIASTTSTDAIIELSTFVQDVKNLRCALLRQLNNEFRSSMEAEGMATGSVGNGTNISRLNDLANEYMRCADNIEKMTGGRLPCDLIGMGSNESFQLTEDAVHPDTTETDALPPQQIMPFFQTVCDAAAGGMHSLAVTVHGRVYSWGNSDGGAIGRRVLSSEDVNALIDSASGEAEAATIGDGSEIPKEITGFKNHLTGKIEDRTITNIAAGSSHILFLTISGNVYMSGSYQDGDSGTFSDPDYEASVSSIKRSNDTPVHVLLPQKCIFIATCECFNVAILEDFTAYTWGFGNSGELARSSKMTQPKADGSYDLGKEFMYNKNIPRLDLIQEHFLTPRPVLYDTVVQKKTVIAAAAGSYHLLIAAREAGQFQSKLYTSGLNNYGQLGHGDMDNRHALTLVKKVENKNIAQVAGGQHFSIVLSHDGMWLYSFGRADYGCLGTGYMGTGEYRSEPAVVRFPARYADQSGRVVIKEITCGERHALAVDRKCQLYTWGFNETGATGHPVKNDHDYFIPRRLDLAEKLSTATQPVAQVDVLGISGGGHHSILRCRRLQEHPAKKVHVS